MNGVIFNVQRFSTDDGPGIRTTVFLKGCPLRCAWCHNPESQERHAEIFFSPEKCIACNECIAVCKTGARTLENGAPVFHRTLCTRCGECAKSCYSKAIEYCGQEREAIEIINELKRDEPFFTNSNGGLTVSGGEPLFQAPFTKELCRLAKSEHIHTCVETSGFGSTEELLSLSEFVDLFLFDYKLSNNADAQTWLGIENLSMIHQNLDALNRRGANIILRCPIIPNINFTNEHFQAIIQLAKRIESIQEIHLLPYHPLGIEKSKRLGKNCLWNDTNFFDGNVLLPYAKEIQEATNIKTTVR